MPERFGAYTVHEELGVGGMASVHVADGPDGKRVAYHAGNLKTEVWVLENFLPGR